MREVFTSASALGDESFESTRVVRLSAAYYESDEVREFESRTLLAKAYYESNEIRAVESTVKCTKLHLFESSIVRTSFGRVSEFLTLRGKTVLRAKFYCFVVAKYRAFIEL